MTDGPTDGPGVPARHTLEELRAIQRRQLATIRGAIPGQVGEPIQPLDELGPGASELQVRMVADELLGPHRPLLDELELDQARDAVERLARRQSDNAWVDTAVRSITQRLPSPFDRPARVDPGNDDDRVVVADLRDAAALLDFADVLSRRRGS